MALKRWILTSMNRMSRINAIVGRPDLVQRDVTARSTGAPREPSLRAGSATRPTAR